MLQRCFFIMVLMLAMAGCAAHSDVNRKQLSELKQNYSQFDLKIAWDVTSDSKETRIDGLIKNVWATQMDDLELWVYMLDAKAETIARTSSYVSNVLNRDETAPFSLILPVGAGPGSKLVFTYSYIPHDGGDTDRWMQSFETVLPMQ